MSELEQRLTQLGHELDWPETPELAAGVRRELHSPVPGRRPLIFRRSLAVALASLLVLAGGVFAAVPSVRDAVLEFFGLQGVTVERRPQLPSVPERQLLALGQPATLAGARDELGFEPVLPRGLGQPDGVFVGSEVPGGELSLTYDSGPGLPSTSTTGLGLLVGEFRGDLAPEFLGKIAGETTRIERLRVDGDRAIWIEGAPHLFFYRPPDSEFAESELRLAQNVLLLERGNLLVRLEGAFGRERALELARSMR
jgi:hypothetical protein